MGVSVYYDGQCPFCSHYVRHMNLKRASGSVNLIDVRIDREAAVHLENLSIDIDKGMVVKVDDQYLHGAQAVHAMAMMSTGVGWFNRINKFIFSSLFLTRILYPVMVFCRNVTLMILGREKINVQ